MLSKKGFIYFKHFLFYEKAQETASVSNLLRLCGKKALQTWLIINAIFNIVTSLVIAWKTACVETSQYIKSHNSSYFTNKLLYSRTCKKDNLCSYERKATYILGQLPAPPLAWLLGQTSFACIDLTWLDIHIWTFLIHIWTFLVQSYGGL